MNQAGGFGLARCLDGALFAPSCVNGAISGQGEDVLKTQDSRDDDDGGEEKEVTIQACLYIDPGILPHRSLAWEGWQLGMRLGVDRHHARSAHLKISRHDW